MTAGGVFAGAKMPVQDDTSKPFEAAFMERRHVGQRARALGAGHAEADQPAARTYCCALAMAVNTSGI